MQRIILNRVYAEGTYPTYMYIPARTPDAFAAAYKLTQLQAVITKGMDIHKVLKSL